jgi:hypothetical protein
MSMGWMAIWLVFQAPPASADISGLQVVKVNVPARAIEAPVLRHRLLPSLEEISTGNAALHFATALTPDAYGFTRNNDFNKKLEIWLNAPLDKLPKDEMRELTNSFILAEADRGARKSYCDWQMKDRLKDGVFTLLPDLQGYRMIANLLRARARLHLADNHPDLALRDIQTTLTLGRDIADGPTLIQHLVGIAVCQIGFNTLQDYMQHRDSANIFWSLGYMPGPFVSLMTAMEGERLFIGAEFPGLERDKPISQEQARLLSIRFEKVMGMASPSTPSASPVFLTGLALTGYTDAKEYLFRVKKLPSQVVEAMPVAQVVLLRQLEEYETIRDEIFKAAMLPAPQALAILRETDLKLKKIPQTMGPSTLLKLVLPGMAGVMRAHHRPDRTIAALRTIEALRHHVARHGVLPENLESIGFPLPVDPFTQKILVYKKIGPMACTLDGIAPDGETPNQSNAIRYEISVRAMIGNKE